MFFFFLLSHVYKSYFISTFPLVTVTRIFFFIYLSVVVQDRRTFVALEPHFFFFFTEFEEFIWL